MSNLLKENSDGQINNLINKLFDIGMPIIWSIAAAGLVFILIKFGFNLHSSPDKKAEHIKHLIWSFLGAVIIFSALAISQILIPKFTSIGGVSY